MALPGTQPDLPRSVLIVGSGGREHALVRAIAGSAARPRIVCAPGNPGMAAEARCAAVAVDDIPGLVDLVRRERIDFVVVGPELPLTLGLADRLAEGGIPVYGPKADGARLEGSKVYTKSLLVKYGIPTAPGAAFTDSAAAAAYIRTRPVPVVVKADGLAAGKGVVVASSAGEAIEAARSMLDAGKFGNSGRQVLIEDRLEGEETSLLVVVSGREYVILPTSQDHKRVGDGDTGPNTGGMGAYSPAEVVTPDLLARIEREIVRPSVDGIADEGIDFRGTLFIGIMLTADGPKVLEYNTRFGDPETQVVFPRLASDALDLLWAAARGRLAGFRLAVRPDYAVCVVLSARGYPESFAKGEPIGLPPSLPPGVSILHAGTADHGGGLVSAGGRVLGVVSLGAGLREAAARAYAACDAVAWAGKHYRRDIGARQLRRDEAVPAP